MLPSLKELQASNCNLRKDTIVAVESNSSITKLDVSSNDLKDTKSLLNNTTITSLSVSHAVNRDGMLSVALNTRLTCLTASDLLDNEVKATEWLYMRV